MVTIISEKQAVKLLFETIKAVFERIWLLLHCAKRINMQTFTLFKCKL